MTINPINIIRNRRERKDQEALEQFALVVQQIRVDTIRQMSEMNLLNSNVS